MTMDVVSVEDDLSVPRPAQVSRAYTHRLAGGALRNGEK